MKDRIFESYVKYGYRKYIFVNYSILQFIKFNIKTYIYIYIYIIKILITFVYVYACVGNGNYKSKMSIALFFVH